MVPIELLLQKFIELLEPRLEIAHSVLVRCIESVQDLNIWIALEDVEPAPQSDVDSSDASIGRVHRAEESEILRQHELCRVLKCNGLFPVLEEIHELAENLR